MATIDKKNLTDALTRLGALAQEQGDSIELVLVGGGLMVLVFEIRQSTRDVDVVILAPTDLARVRDLAKAVGIERNWPENWLNDAAKGFMVGVSDGPIVLSSPGIVVRRPAIEQLLAMKLCAWRDDIDIADARRLLMELHDTYNETWKKIEPYLQPGRELKARYAFDDLWEELNGSHGTTS